MCMDWVWFEGLNELLYYVIDWLGLNIRDGKVDNDCDGDGGGDDDIWLTFS